MLAILIKGKKQQKRWSHDQKWTLMFKALIGMEGKTLNKGFLYMIKLCSLTMHDRLTL